MCQSRTLGNGAESGWTGAHLVHETIKSYLGGSNDDGRTQTIDEVLSGLLRVVDAQTRAQIYHCNTRARERYHTSAGTAGGGLRARVQAP